MSKVSKVIMSREIKPLYKQEVSPPMISSWDKDRQGRDWLSEWLSDLGNHQDKIRIMNLIFTFQNLIDYIFDLFPHLDESHYQSLQKYLKLYLTYGYQCQNLQNFQNIDILDILNWHWLTLLNKFKILN